MRNSLKIRTFLLLVAVLFTGLVLSLPAPAMACWINFVQECTYPDGSKCYIYCPGQSCPGASCCHTDQESCCPA